MSSGNYRLTEVQQRLLLQTPDNDLTIVFKGFPRQWLRDQKVALFKTMDPKDIMGVDAERARARAKERSLQAMYGAAVGEAEGLKKELETALRMRDNLKMQTLQIKASGPKRHEATAVVLASDWHAEEPVIPGKVNHLNKYDVEVFEARSKKFFENAVKLVKKEQAGVEIKNLILWLGGDFITGNIHDDTTFQNQLGPMDALLLVQQVIAGGLMYLLENLPDVKVTIPCSAGNHSRITKKQMIKSEQEYSLETLMYHNLKMAFAEKSSVQFILSPGYHTYVDVHGYVLRFHHGHAINYQGGIGGITIPVLKAVARWNRSRTAYLDLFGHFHQRFDGGCFLANGSMIGYNEYALNIGAGYEPPQQQFCLIDSLHGKTVVAPVLLEEVNPNKKGEA